MIKISFFVEGQTERIFLEKLLDEYFNPSELVIDSYKLIGRDRHLIRQRKTYSGVRYYALIYEVGGDDRVVSALLDMADNMLNKAGYNHLIALRDLFRKPIGQKHKVINAVLNIFNEYSFAAKLKHVLAIMETEAWFLADCDLFSRLDPQLTPAYINNNLGIDLVNDDPETCRHPSKVIDDIFRLIGSRYKTLLKA